MNIRLANFIFLFFLYSQAVFAIDPVYEGNNGIRAQVFATNCLVCHSSELSGSQRNGAPANVNYDTFSSALEKADRAVVRAVEQMTMPPSSPKLNQEQKDALLAWQQAGFPESQTSQDDSPDEPLNNATFDFDTLILTLPVVNVGESTFQATLKLISLPGTTFGFGFVLENADPTNDISTTEATFTSATGIVEIPEIDLLNNPSGSSKVKAQMLLIPETSPLEFEVTSLDFIN